MFDIDVMWKWFKNLCKEKYQQLMCDHLDSVVTRDDGDLHVEYCLKCGKRIVIRKNWNLWK